MNPFASFRMPRTASGRKRGRNRGRSLGLLSPLALLLVLAACTGAAATPAPTITPTPTAVATAAPTATPAPAFPVTITDDEGTTVAVAAEPQRIVSLTPAATETLFAIGAGDRVAAKVEDISPFPPEADGLPVVATYQGVDIEQIVSLKADLVIAGGLGFTPPAAVAQLRSLGIPVIVLYAESVDEALAGIDAVGLASGRAEAASALTTAMRTEFDRLAALVQSSPRPLTFYEIDATSEIYTVPAGSLYDELLRLAGADPITTDASYQISLEKLITANPAVILLGDGGYTTPADVAARPNWSGIKAVVDGNIFPVNDTLITRPGPRLVDGLRALIAALHPEVQL
ncbi:MAG: ABC transporter substrate-binding protein [Chloroflexota bacterium]